MKYLNQLEYRHIPYKHNMAAGGPPEGRDNVATSGCGLCCAAMVIDALTDKSLSIEECVKLSEENQANLCLGTSMSVLGGIIAEKYGLDYSRTNELSEVISHIQRGGAAIVLVGHKEGMAGLFTMRSHYMTLVACDGKEFCILDPSYTKEKYEIPERVGRVNTANAPYLYCDVNTVDSEAIENKYHLFSRKKL
ncbi:MAG: C39 family peptidase [Clostridia bacterium]|nr:C39 family peptidase [Clostridia bacterium]